jgi:hypothetical protein
LSAVKLLVTEDILFKLFVSALYICPPSKLFQALAFLVSTSKVPRSKWPIDREVLFFGLLQESPDVVMTEILDFVFLPNINLQRCGGWIYFLLLVEREKGEHISARSLENWSQCLDAERSLDRVHLVVATEITCWQ